jgi:hypothetical protein
MSAILPYIRNEAFDQQDITALSAALDDVCKELEIGRDATAREVIATRIIELAQRGERSPIRLRDRVLAEANGVAQAWGGP